MDPELGVQSVTVLVQKEVAVRMTSEPGSKDYGALTLLIALHGQAALRLSVPHQAFLPPPKVDSAVVRIEMPSRIALSGEERQQVNAVIRRIFQQRRKMMARTLQAATGAPIGEIREALQQEGIQGSARPEQVSLEQLVHILQRIGYINGRNRIE